MARAGLITALILHVYFTIKITRENREARTARYAVDGSKRDDLNFARRYMIYTGVLVFFFLFLHLWDFTLSPKEGERLIIPGANDNEELGLYAVVWNDLSQFWRAFVYIAAVCAVGMHLSHGIQSLFQTLGINHERWSPMIIKASVAIGIVVAVGFSLIPIYIILRGTPSV
jgi:succinate dehydrogenase / fumarate reductase, cytochrome b subunit